MSRSLNKVLLIGNVGADPEIRTASTGSRVASFSLATTRTWNGAGGDKQEKTEWHRCSVWASSKGPGLVEVVEKYVRKGSQLYIEGRIEYRQYQDKKDGQTKYATDINVREMLLLGSKGGAGASGEYEGGSRSSAPARARSNAGNAARPGGEGNGSDDFEDFPGALEDGDDDLPF